MPGLGLDFSSLVCVKSGSVGSRYLTWSTGSDCAEVQ